MSGLGVICNCCNSGVFNICSFESDGTLRWAVDWGAIKGSSNGGMDVVQFGDGPQSITLGIKVVGSYLLAVGTKSGNVHAAALNLSDGSEALSLTDTGEAFDLVSFHTGTDPFPVVSGELLFGGTYGSGTSEALKRYAIDTSGNATVTTSSAFGASSTPREAFISPAGELVGCKLYSSGGTVELRVKSIDGSGSTGSYDHAVHSAEGAWGRGSEAFYARLVDDGDGPPDRHMVKFAVPISGAPSSVSSPGDDTYPAGGTQMHKISSTNADHVWIVRPNGSFSDVVRYVDLPNDSPDFTKSYTDLGTGAASDFYTGADDVLYMVPYKITGAMKISAVDVSGTVYNESATIANNIVGSNADYKRVFSDASGYAVCGWPTNVTSTDVFNAARFQRTGGNLVIQWQWDGVPELCKTVDGSGNLYFANVNGLASLPVSGLSQVV